MSGKNPMPTVSNPMPISTRVAKQPAAFNQKSVKQQLVSGKLAPGDNTKRVPKESMKSHSSCLCHSNSKEQQTQKQQQQQQLQGLQLKKNDLPPSTSDQSINANSSDIGVRKVLGQIHRICTQMQLSDLNDEGQQYNPLAHIPQMEMGSKHVAGSVNAVSSVGKIKPSISTVADEAEQDTPVDSMDEIEIDNFQYSSDEMSSYSDESDMKFTGNMTVRAPLNTSRPKIAGQLSHKGAGDGQ